MLIFFLTLINLYTAKNSFNNGINIEIHFDDTFIVLNIRKLYSSIDNCKNGTINILMKYFV